ncbi:RagB/SusD family nutrient uptake outer membrane protein [Bacteroides sp. UBA939]|uniref:RagB/SusD family nutrient uptake outer membrane protein n=1 Tax=Bacteroides sp. UBA939 TaxID=1946092 RepID=UPI0025BAD018|nr:RagB/SusD family nutrient uptake outer membrane protein [Bacteroides sp. UBA939]
MKIKDIKYWVISSMLCIGLNSCEDFLDRPSEDNYNVGTFYQNDEQCIQGVNYLYNSPWYDFQRGFIKIGEVFSGNLYWGDSPYMNFSVNGTDGDLINMAYSLWAVNGHANTVYTNLQAAIASESVRNQCMGECLVWKAMAYFYLVRTFGEVPIIHDNNAELTAGTYNEKYKVRRENVYEYIIMTLEKALELLPKRQGELGRIDYYAAEALMAKVYLTRSGLNQKGTRNQADLDKAAEFAKDVIDNSGRQLMEVYSDIFRLKNNKSEESLIAWHWTVSSSWTSQNTLQSDIAMVGFSEFGDCWGGFIGPSVDLQDAFGVDALKSPEERHDTDVRRKATMMMPGDVYNYFWTDKGGFDYLRFIYDTEYGAGGPGGAFQSNTGANCVKHLYGDAYDHKTALGIDADRMASGLSTHILRLGDVYLIYAEAVLGNAASTTDASALEAFNAVRSRGKLAMEPLTSLTFDDIWKERRLELAMEGDRWYDYVRLSYYDPKRATDELMAQRRNGYYGLDDLYSPYYESGAWSYDPDEIRYDADTPAPNVAEGSFTLPFPTEDVVFNPNLQESVDAINIDVRSEFSY